MSSFLPADLLLGGPPIGPALEDVANRAHAEFDDHLDPRTVDECLEQVAARFDGAKVRDFVPLLVQRYVREDLQMRRRQACTDL